MQVELLPGGKNIPVTNANKANYILLTANYRLNVEIRLVTNAFLRGLESVIAMDWLQMFNEEELQMLIRGVKTTGIDIEELQHNIEYGNGYSPQHPTIQAFWQVRPTVQCLQQSFLRLDPLNEPFPEEVVCC